MTYNKLLKEGKADIFFHNKLRTILIKKKEEAAQQSELRTISIIQAWLMIIEKAINPLISSLYDQTLSSYQFGFRPNRDCSLAKAMIAYYAKKEGMNKNLLVDVRKAYDSVTREKLLDKIKLKYGERGNILKRIMFHQS